MVAMPGSERWKRWLRWGVSVGILLLSLALAFHLVQWEDFLEALRYAAQERLWLFVPVIVVAHLVRAWRWQFLIEAALGRRPNLGHAFAAVMIGYAVNAIVPRAGELVRPYVLSRREAMPLATLLSGVLIERLLDAVTVVLLLVVTLVLFSEELFTSVAGSTESVAFGVAVGVALLGGAVALLASIRRWGRWVIRQLHRWTPRWSHHGGRILEELRSGVSILGEPWRSGVIVGLTVALWFLYWVPLYGLFWVFGLPLGPVEAFQLLVVSSVAIALAPTPSAAGVYHVAVQLTLMKFFAVAPAQALAYATVAHGVNTLVMLVLGGLCWLWEQGHRLG